MMRAVDGFRRTFGLLDTNDDSKCANAGSRRGICYRIVPDGYGMGAGLTKDDRRAVQTLADQYGITIAISTEKHEQNGTRCLPASRQLRQGYLHEFRLEFAAYPVAFIRKTKLRAIYFCSHIRKPTRADTKGDSLGIPRGGYTSYATRSIHLNVSAAKEITAKEKFPPPEASANRPRNGENIKRQKRAPPPSGFVSRYAKINSMEDRAETFLYLVAHSRKTQVRSYNDAGVKAKVAFIYEQLAAFSSELDAAFWRRRAKYAGVKTYYHANGLRGLRVRMPTGGFMGS